jgi:hypothetical protein
MTMTKKLPTINIKGKEYIMVKDRVLAFNELYPKGAIATEIISNTDKSVVVKAVVKPEDGRIFTGHSEAYREGAMGDVPIEVAETSAVGRALAMMGIGIVDGVASADEMVKAAPIFKKSAMVTEKQKKFIEALWQQKDQMPKDPFAAFENMTAWEGVKEINRLKALPTVDEGDHTYDIEGTKADYDPDTGALLP